MIRKKNTAQVKTQNDTYYYLVILLSLISFRDVVIPIPI